MGQSAWTSAVGLALESLWRKAPITGSSNPRSIGAAGTNPLRFQIVEPSPGIDPMAVMESREEIDGSIEDVRLTLLAKTYRGQFTFPVDSETVYYWALGMLGRDVQTTVAAAGGGNPAVYDHALSPYLHAPSFTIEEDLGTRDAGRLTSGALIEALSLDLGSKLMAKASVIGHRHIPNTYNLSGADTQFAFGSSPGLLPTQMGGDGTMQVTSTASPSYVDVAAGATGNGPLTWAGLTYGSQSGFASAYMTIRGTAVPIELLPGSRLDLARKIISVQAGGSGYDPGSVGGGKVAAKGELAATFSSMMLPAAVLDFSQVALDLLFRGPQIGTSGYYYELEIYLPHVKLERAPVSITGDLMQIDASFRVRMDATGGHGVQLRLRNTFSNASLAGLWTPPCALAAATVDNASPTISVNTSAGFAAGDSVTILGASSNPYTVANLPDATHLTFSGNVRGAAPIGASVLKSNYGPGGLGGWANS